MRVVLSPAADDDLDAILHFGFETWDESAALDYADRLRSTIQQLATFPKLGQRVNGIPDRFRMINVGRHRIFYRVDPDQLLIVRVLHQRSDTPTITH